MSGGGFLNGVIGVDDDGDGSAEADGNAVSINISIPYLTYALVAVEEGMSTSTAQRLSCRPTCS